MTTLLERFESKLQQEGDCIVFTGCRNARGYGEIGIHSIEPSDNPSTRKKALAHRVAWRLKYGVWPTGILRHTCDNPPCVKIAHLRDGTHKDNADDCTARGRRPHGEAVPSHILTEDQVLEIRALCAGRSDPKRIGEMYGISSQYVYSIIKGRAWGHLPCEKTRKPYSCQHIEIAGDLWTVEEIAEHAGVGNHTIRGRLKRGLTGESLLAGKHQGPRKPRGS